ncbi:response regulator transcription factor [Luteimonas sp. BDR2-5]|uniref:response regulator n=1 Tax=Proluteimonas luteida TaxID=2878685 RepID=UPI001E4B4AD2|nr:response regulator transcription factor [Luteimonas sp. BDR2-5]MCD9029747.1 response regulator transcription factor [Luteimonas sp. BDR2-5]
MRILVVEDDLAVARGIMNAARTQGWAVDHVARGQLAVDEALAVVYAVVILDLGLPDLDGLDVLRRLRARGSTVPVLVLTARDRLVDRVSGLDAGADDYLLKPFDLDELSARVRALARRSQGAALTATLCIGRLEIDRGKGEACVDGETLDLRPREWAVLDALAVHPGTLVGRERLASEIFSHEDPVTPNALDVHVGRLRRKLSPFGITVRTVRGRGYVLEA